MIWTIGVLALLYVLREPAMIIYRLFRAPKNLLKNGKWAIVTGATDGIGKAIAGELAKKGLNILLISRTESKLVATQAEIKAHGVEADYLTVDYSNFDADAQESVRSKVSELELKGGVAVLVNNVGVSYSFPKYYHERSPEDVARMVSLNITSTSTMTHIVLPGMLSRKGGDIVNISSGASMQPSPLLAQYCGAKSYINALSKSLDMEYRAKGVAVQSQVPLFVTTKLSKIRSASLTTPTPKVYAKASVNAIGYESLVSPFWAHALLLWVLSLLPDVAIEKIMMGMHLGLRKRGMKKEAEKAKAQ